MKGFWNQSSMQQNLHLASDLKISVATLLKSVCSPMFSRRKGDVLENPSTLSNWQTHVFRGSQVSNRLTLDMYRL